MSHISAPIDEVLGTSDPDFTSWVESMPDKYWAKYDLSACRIGWEARRRFALSKGQSGIIVPIEAITDGPSIRWRHIDGPLLSWAGQLHWLTLRQAIAILLRLMTVDEIASLRWPGLAQQRARLMAAKK